MIKKEVDKQVRKKDERMIHRVNRIMTDYEETVVNHIDKEYENGISFADRLADRFTCFGGSWKFIIIFAVFLAVWIVWNVLPFTYQTLKIFRSYNDESVDDGICVIIPGEKQMKLFEKAITSIKYATFSSSIPYSEINNEHFSIVFQPARKSRGESVCLEEGRHRIFASPENLHRRLPGPLKPELLRMDDEKKKLINQVFIMIQKSQNRKLFNVLKWYCKAFRWNADEYDRLIYLLSALEMFLVEGKTTRKAEGLGVELAKATIDDPSVIKWGIRAYEVRNSILHMGEARGDELIYRDIKEFQVDYHENIAKIFFKEIFEKLIEPTKQISSDNQAQFIAAFSNVLKRERVFGAVFSNRYALERILDILNKEIPSKEELHELRVRFSHIKKQDFSLDHEGYEEYISKVVAIKPKVETYRFQRKELT